jgi:hypothetical protein
VIVLAWSSTACTPVPIVTSPATTSPVTASPAATSTIQTGWQTRITTIPRPGPGCFTASYPTLAWTPVACTTPPPYPQVPAPGPLPAGGGVLDDVVAYVPLTGISSATGSFDRVSGVTREDGPIGNAGMVPNAYSLQLNTKPFLVPGCPGPNNPDCRAWQQFVFDNASVSATAYIQYWLIKYNQDCPDSTWKPFSFNGSTDIYCWKDNPAGPVPVPAEPIDDLAHLRLTGAVTKTGDGLILTDDPPLAGHPSAYALSGPDIGAVTGWDTAEFNVFGDGGDETVVGRPSSVAAVRFPSKLSHISRSVPAVVRHRSVSRARSPRRPTT